MSGRILDRLLTRLGNRAKRPQPPVPPAPYVDSERLLPPEALLRLGTEYGGWIIPAEHGLAADSMCYLAGAGEDISFDCEIVHRFGCRARILDPTPRAIAHFEALQRATLAGSPFAINNSETAFYSVTPADLGRVQFLPFGLSDADTALKFFMPRNPAHVSCSTANLQGTEQFFVAQCHRLATIMALQGDTRLDLLKMDIEGGEYSVIRDLVQSGPLPRLLLIEFDEIHTPQDGDAPQRIQRHIDMLITAGMRCIAVDGCNFSFVRENVRSHDHGQ